MSLSTELSFANDIRPLFSDMDIDHMRKHIDLSDRDIVFANADAIYAAVVAGTMPPADCGEARWSQDLCARFKSWHDRGGAP